MHVRARPHVRTGPLAWPASRTLEHPRGVFRGATVRITFYDVIPDPGTSGASNFLHSGDIDLKG